MTFSGGEGCPEGLSLSAAPCTPSQQRTEERLQSWISLCSKKRPPQFFFFLNYTLRSKKAD